MTSLLLLGILLAVGLSVQANPNYQQMEKQKALLDALRFVEKAMDEQVDSDESIFEEDFSEENLDDPYYGNDYEKYIQENWPEMAPEINLQPGPPIEEPPFNSVDNWQDMGDEREFPIGQGYPIVESESEDTNDVLMTEELESVESVVIGDEQVNGYDIDDETLERIIEAAIQEGTLGGYGESEAESVEYELEPETSEVDLEDLYRVENVDQITEEEEEMMNQFTEELIDELREEVAEEIEQIAQDAVRDLADEITAEVVEEIENGEIELSDIEKAFGPDSEMGAASESEPDEDDTYPEFQVDSASEEEDYQIVKRDGEDPFGAWYDAANDDVHDNEVVDDEVMEDSENEVDDMDDLTWEALQYLYGPYLDNIKQDMMKYDSDEDVSNEIDNDFDFDSEQGVINVPEESYIEDVEGASEDVPDYDDYSESVEDPYDTMYEQAIEDAIVQLEDEAAATARQLVDEMLLGLVEEEQRKEELEEEEAYREQLTEQYGNLQQCEILDYVMDDCEVIDRYEGLGDNGYKEAFTRPCNRHQLCYTCGATYQLQESICDEVFYNEMESMCEDSAKCRLKAKYFLMAAQQSREAPQSNPYVDFVCRNRCVFSALYQ